MARLSDPTSRWGASAVAVVLAVAALGGSPAGATGPAQARRQPAAPPQQRQQPSPAVSFLTQVTLVEVDTVVLGRDGRIVSDLRPDEFEVFEGGKRQKIESVRLVDIPITTVAAVPAPTTPTAVADVTSNADPANGRLYLIVLDDLHIAPIRTNIARRIARDFIDRTLAPGDLAAVVPTSGNRRAVQDFTTDKTRLRRAVDAVVGQKVISPWLAGVSGNVTPEEVGPSDSAAPLRINNARSAVDTLSRLAAIAGTIRNRRKAMVVVGEGIDYVLGAPGQGQAEAAAVAGEPLPLPTQGFVNEGSAPRELLDKVSAFISIANRANVSLYALDPRVYTHGGDEAVDIASGIPSVENAPNRLTAIQDSLRASQDNLRTLATGTGGFAATGSPKDVAGAFERIRTENSVYYMLSYAPSNEAADGKFRAIEVRVSRPGVSVRARKGYTAPKANASVASMPALDVPRATSPALREAMVATLPVAGLTLRTTAYAFKGEAREASVVVLVQLDGRELLFTPADDRFVDTVELAVTAVDRDGRTRAGEHLNLEMPLSARNHDLVTEAGVVIPVRLALPPGEFELRVGGRDAGSMLVGSVHHAVEVPDFAASPFAMSGVVVTADEAGLVPMPRPDDRLEHLLPGTPITTREFSRTDTVRAAVELYDTQRDPSRTIAIVTTIRTPEGRILSTHTQTRSAKDVINGRVVAQVAVRLQDVQAGDYVLAIEARSNLLPDRVERREVPFSVR